MPCEGFGQAFCYWCVMEQGVKAIPIPQYSQQIVTESSSVIRAENIVMGKNTQFVFSWRPRASGGGRHSII